MAIRVLVNGAGGRMGRETCQAIISDPELELYIACDTNSAYLGKDIGDLLGTSSCGVTVEADLPAALAKNPDVMIDFTHPSSVKMNIDAAINAGVDCVIGTTGLTDKDLKVVERTAADRKVNVLVAPNFAIGAVLMMRLAETAARYLSPCEIIELHHDKKADAPSGTALKTANNIGQGGDERLKPGEKETQTGARGAVIKGVHIHSIRLPGLVAHQEVIFGGTGQTLTIRHDSIDRTSFMPGVILAIKKIREYPGLTYGLDEFLD